MSEFKYFLTYQCTNSLGLATGNVDMTCDDRISNIARVREVEDVIAEVGEVSNVVLLSFQLFD